MTKKRLGRGLGALIPTAEAESEVAQDSIRILPVTDIQPNPQQPRTSQMDQEQLAQLAASIKEHGLIQPLIVTEQKGQYYLIAGERRWRASQLAELAEVPVVVKEATRQDMLELAIIENVQRADLNALEEAYAYQQLIEDFGMTQEQVADSVGKGRSTVANLLRLLTLPENIQQAVLDGEISGAHARALLPLPTPEMQANAMKRIMELNLSVRQTERLVKNLMATEKPKAKPKKALPPELLDLQNQFEQSLGTRVSISKKRKGGQVVIDYYSDEELQTIYEVIVGSE
jgi:ParB family chromosome partitioning protein